MTLKPQKTITVSIPPRLADTDLHDAMVECDGAPCQVRIMAGSLQFVTPLALCRLRALVDHAALHAQTVVFDPPVLTEASNYLSRMNFYEDLDKSVEVSRTPPTLTRADRRDRLIELQRIQTIEHVEFFMDRAWRVVQPHFASQPLAKACVSALGAATENVIDHAQAQSGALVAAQLYERIGLDLAVVDLGLGIPATLRANAAFSHLSDLEALGKALEDGVTCTGLEGRGAGLCELVTNAQRAGNSTLVIQSGDARISLASFNGQSQVSCTTAAQPIRGTWISLRLQPSR